MSRPDLDALAGDADSFVGWPSFDSATADPSQVASHDCGCYTNREHERLGHPSLDQDRERADHDRVRNLAGRAVAALREIRELMDEAIIRHHTPGDWRARMDAVLDEAPR